MPHRRSDHGLQVGQRPGPFPHRAARRVLSLAQAVMQPHRLEQPSEEIRPLGVGGTRAEDRLSQVTEQPDQQIFRSNPGNRPGNAPSRTGPHIAQGNSQRSTKHK
jgi:hypothetical protein